MSEPKILHLTVNRKWFDKIYSGRKRWEFREAKQYWITRLEGKTFDQVHIKCGYQKYAPLLIMKCLGIKRRKLKGYDFYAINLAWMSKNPKTSLHDDIIDAMTGAMFILKQKRSNNATK